MYGKKKKPSKKLSETKDDITVEQWKAENKKLFGDKAEDWIGNEETTDPEADSDETPELDF